MVEKYREIKKGTSTQTKTQVQLITYDIIKTGTNMTKLGWNVSKVEWCNHRHRITRRGAPIPRKRGHNGRAMSPIRSVPTRVQSNCCGLMGYDLFSNYISMGAT